MIFDSSWMNRPKKNIIIQVAVQLTFRLIMFNVIVSKFFSFLHFLTTKIIIIINKVIIVNSKLRCTVDIINIKYFGMRKREWLWMMIIVECICKEKMLLT